VEVIACELNEMLSKDGLSWNQELAYPKRSVPFGYAQGNSAKRLNLRWGLSAGSFEPFDGTQGWLIERLIAVFGCHKPAKFSKFWQNRIVALRRVAASDLIDSDRSRIELCGSHFDVSRIPETWKFPSASEFAKHPAHGEFSLS